VYSASYVFSKTYVINPALSYDSTQYNIAQNIKTTNIADNIKYWSQPLSIQNWQNFVHKDQISNEAEITRDP
jgi:hypothetical protein